MALCIQDLHRSVGPSLGEPYVVAMVLLVVAVVADTVVVVLVVGW